MSWLNSETLQAKRRLHKIRTEKRKGAFSLSFCLCCKYCKCQGNVLTAVTRWRPGTFSSLLREDSEDSQDDPEKDGMLVEGQELVLW